jgi:AcrR family transcriptional regulator
MKSAPEPRPRERILETAGNLFYTQGYRAVGVDKIIADSGVAKMTFYKHFPSKDDLIVAYLQNATDGFWRWMDGILLENSDPKAGLLAIFVAVAKLSSSPACLGCAFAHAAGEFPDHNHPAHAVAKAYKQGVLQKLEALSRAMGAKDPVGLSQDLMLLMDGAWAAARMFGANNHAARAAQTARVLIEAQVST